MYGAKIISILQPQLSASAKFSLPKANIDGVGVQRWTDWKAPTFNATIKPGTVEDVQTIVKWATENKIPFLAVAGGHGFGKGFEKAKDVLEIDLSNFKSISVDANANTVTVGGAVKFQEIYDPVFEAGKEMPVGACGSAGVVGVSLGAGLNRWQGIYGTLSDNLLEVQMVTADGSLTTASQTTNPDLFWGIRGAGFNFGVVMSATYRIYDQRTGGKSMSADLIFPFEKSGEIVRILKKWEIDQPEALAIGTSAMWNPEAGGACHVVSILYHGPLDEGMKLIQPFLDLGPMKQDISMVPWNEIEAKWGFGAGKQLSVYGGIKNLYSGHVKAFDLPTFEWYFEALKKLWEEYPACRGTLCFIEDWPTKKMVEIPDTETAFPHRDVVCQMIFLCATEDPALGEMLDKWGSEVRNKFRETNGFPGDKVYVSYGQGDESQEALYGARKLERLRALKKKWDPSQAFSFNNPIKI